MLWKVGDLDNCLATTNYGSMFRKDLRLSQEHCSYSNINVRQQFKRNSKGQYVHSQSTLCLTADKVSYVFACVCDYLTLIGIDTH